MNCNTTCPSKFSHKYLNCKNANLVQAESQQYVLNIDLEIKNTII